ncbi:MAG: insulinase family protein, partial [Bacteroidaceae bacterium]|nr:insulinase family protein [Bacteroidaceae bacterium]
MLNTHTLANGLRIVHTLSPTGVTYCGYAIKAGTRHELLHQQGMAHLVEHMIFKGTTHRRACHIINRMEHVGGDLNAYTNKEEMVVYAAFLKEHTERAIELLTDIVFHSTFPQHEMDKEVEVVVDEILSYEDTPQELIYDDFEELIFPNHPLGRNILGKPEQLRTYRTIDAQAFTKQHYRPDNMVLFVKGNIDFLRIVRWAEKYAGSIPSIPLSIDTPNALNIPLPNYQARTLTLEKDTHQAHVLVGGRAYDANDERRTALYLLNNMLGGPGMNSRLNISLREKRGLVYTVESNLTSYTDTGAWCIYFGCDHEDVNHCLYLV